MAARLTLRRSVLALSGVLLFTSGGLMGCAPTSPPAEEAQAPSPRSDDQSQAKPRVLTTFTILADMARQVAGDHLQVESITRTGAEIHGYEPTPSDLRRAEGAQLVLVNGFGLERWADRFLSGLPDVRRVVLTEGIEPLPIAGDVAAGKPNPHAWMSPRLAELYVENIRKAFTKLDPAHAADFKRNAEAYRADLRALDKELRRDLDTLPPQHRVLATCEGAFSYLARDYGLTEAYLWPVNAESQVTPQRMARLIATVRERQVPAVFCESTVSAEAQKQVAAESGSRFAGVFFVDSLSPEGGPASSLLELQRHNVFTLINGLKGR
jgi:manganese transport system substrate-binding protein